MANKKKQTEKAAVNADTTRRIWTILKPDDWLDFFSKFRSGHDFHIKGTGANAELWGRCIYHQDPNASFHVRMGHGYAKCFGECSTFVDDPIAMAAHAMGKAYADAFNFLATTYGLAGLSPSLIQEVQELNKKQTVKSVIAKLLNRELIDAAGIGRGDPQFAYAQPLVDWLESRKIPLDLLHALPIGVIPPAHRLWERLNEYERQEKVRYHTEVQNYLAENNGAVPISATQKGPYEGWLLFVNHTAPGQIGQFRIREPGTKELRMLTERENPTPMGFFGLGAGLYQTVIGNTENDKSEIVTVVEGEFTALAAMIPQITSGNLQQIVIAAGGNNNHSLDQLEAVGFKEARILGDRDGGGITFNNLHLKDTRRLKCRVFNWPLSINAGKDLHNVWETFGENLLMAELNNENNYVFAHAWALQRLNEERTTYKPDDVGGLSKLAIRIGGLLNDSAEKEVYVVEAAKLLGISEVQLKKHVASPDSEDGFVGLLCQALEREYRLLYHESSGSSTRISAWNRRHGKMTEFDTAKKNTIVSALNIDIGNIVSWVEDQVGEPEWLKPIPDENGNIAPKRLEVKRKEYESFIVEQAIPRLVQGLPSKATLTPLGQGIHYKDGVLYVVNGTTFCKGEVKDERVVWTDVDGTADGNFYLMGAGAGTTPYTWSSHFSCAADLNNAAPVDVKATFQKVKSFFEAGWVFEDHTLETNYMAGFVLSVAMSSVFRALPWIFVNAPYQSGKSYLLLNALSNTNKTSPIHLLESSFGADVFSEPGVRQRMSDSTLLLVLDEFEVGDQKGSPTKHQRACREILENMRGANQAGTTVTLGSTAGKSIQYNLRCAFAAAGINKMNTRADVSRFNMIYLRQIGKSGVNGTTPEALVIKKLGVAGVQELQRDITMFALQNILKVKDEYATVRQEFQDAQYFDALTESRFKESMLPVLTILKMAGIDHKTFATSYSKVKVEKIAETYSTNEYDDLWNSLLFSPGVEIGTDEYKGRSFTLAQLIADPRMRHCINDTGTGVYWVQRSNNLIINWHTVVRKLLHGSPFAQQSPVALKGLASSDRRVLTSEAIMHDRATFQTALQYGCKITDISVIPAEHLAVSQIKEEGADIESHIVAQTTPAEPLRASLEYDLAVEKTTALSGAKDNI